MGLKHDLQDILDDVKVKMREIYGEYLDKIILYGSYARGDYRDESDIDIMVLVKCGDDEIKKLRKNLTLAASRLGLEYDIYISIKVKSSDYFDSWKDIMPFFKNVKVEGIEIYA